MIVRIAMTAAFLLFALSLYGCSDGPIEEAGEDVGQALEHAGNQVEDACEKAKENLELKDDDC